MKLASLNIGRDGQLLVVSNDLDRAVPAYGIAQSLQAALDDWTNILPRLEKLAGALADGRVSGAFDLDPGDLCSPLPRAYQWADGSAYVNHVELVRRARGAEMPKSFWTDPLMYQGGSDSFIGPYDDIAVASDAWGIDFEAEVAVITDDVPMGTTKADAGGHIKLIMLVNDVSLRGLIPGELGKGFGFFHGKPSTAFAPVAVSPDVLGDAWDGGRLHLPLFCDLNGQPFGRANVGQDMTFDFPTLIAHAAKTRPLCAGTIVGSGTVSNKQDAAHGSALADGGVGYSCIAEVRMLETIRDGAPKTPFMTFGDHIHIEMPDGEGYTIFGAIDQVVVRYEGP